MTEERDGYTILNWNEQFKGDTFILYENYPTAIVNFDRYSDYESLFAVLVHELFHGYQYLMKESRFPNEFLGCQYPILEENVELRNRERVFLYNAVHCDTFIEKKKNIQQFIELREQRASLMNL